MLRNLQNRHITSFQIEQIANILIKATTQPENLFDNQYQQYKKETKNITQPNLNIINRLYQPTQYTRKNEERRLEKLYKQLKDCKNFKVENTISKKLNKKNPSKPIFERTQDIINDRQRKISQTKIYQDTQGRISPPKTKKKINPNDFNEKQKSYQKKKNNYINHKRAQKISQQFSKLKPKPVLTQQTQELLKSSKYADKNILQRFQQHSAKKSYSNMMTIKKISELQTPFVPNINKKSKLLASRSFFNLRQSSSVFERITRNPSKQQINKTYIQQTQTKQPYKQNCQLKGRSKSKNDILDITFNNQRAPLRSLSKSNLNKNNQKVMSRSKINLNHIQSCNYLQDEQKQNSENMELQKIINGNKQQVINFVKSLIIKQKLLEP